MPGVELVRSPWAEDFDDFGRAIRSEAIVVAPFIGAKPLAQLAALLDTDQPPQVELITNLAADSLLHGTVDVAAIAQFGRALPAVTVRHLPSLHAKAYVADDNLAIITSGNMTGASLYHNQEYGVKITDPEVVRQIAADIREYSSLGTDFSLSELDKVAEITRNLQSKYQAAFRTARHRAARELRAEMAETRKTLYNLRAKDGETGNAIFTRTLLYILKRGPLATREIYPIVASLQPDLCDDSIHSAYRAGTGVRQFIRWQHMVRRAQQSLKDRGQIESVSGKWRLVQADTAAYQEDG